MKRGGGRRPSLSLFVLFLSRVQKVKVKTRFNYTKFDEASLSSFLVFDVARPFPSFFLFFLSKAKASLLF